MNTKPATVAALAITCPVCKALPGENCLNGGALPFKIATTRWAHPNREKAARRA